MSPRVVLNKRVVYAVSAFLLVASVVPFYIGARDLDKGVRFWLWAKDSPVPRFAWSYLSGLWRSALFNIAAGLTLAALAFISLAYQKLRG